jgi:hypothetical protein
LNAPSAVPICHRACYSAASSRAGAASGSSSVVISVNVCLGHPATVQLNASQVTQLEATCSGINTQNQQQDNTNVVTLGNAYIS